MRRKAAGNRKRARVAKAPKAKKPPVAGRVEAAVKKREHPAGEPASARRKSVKPPSARRVSQPLLVVGVTGMRCSGKSVFAEEARKLGFKIFEMSTPVVERMRARGMILTNRSLRIFAGELREKLGADFLARESLERIKSARAGKFAVVGIRSPAEAALFRKSLGERFVLVAITSSAEKRLSRALARSRGEDPKSEVDFAWADGMELSLGLGEVMRSAQAHLENESSLESFRESAKAFLLALEGRPFCQPRRAARPRKV